VLLGHQAADALATMGKLVSETISQGRDVADPAAMDAQIHAFRSAALIRASQTAARSSALMKSTTRWPAACWTARTTTSGLPAARAEALPLQGATRRLLAEHPWPSLASSRLFPYVLLQTCGSS
jgi:hypothetical protein